MTKKEKTSLGEGIKILEKNIALHPALKDAYSKLYGWSSDDGGIRYSLMEESNLTMADAKYMLVICSALTNYIIEKSIIV